MTVGHLSSAGQPEGALRLRRVTPSLLAVPGNAQNAQADGVAAGRKGGRQVKAHWAACDRPTPGVLAVVSAAVGTALAIDGLMIVWAAATFLDPQCGEDIAWLALVAAGLGASLAAFVAVAVVARWWWRGRPPASLPRAARMLAAVVTASAVLTSVAVLWLPDGSCP
jgi:hypothetical protein